MPSAAAPSSAFHVGLFVAALTVPTGLLYAYWHPSLGAACVLVLVALVTFQGLSAARPMPPQQRPLYAGHAVREVYIFGFIIVLLQTIADAVAGVSFLGVAGGIACFVGSLMLILGAIAQVADLKARYMKPGEAGLVALSSDGRRTVDTATIRATLADQKGLRRPHVKQFPPLITSSKAYARARDNRSFSTQAHMLQSCDAAIAARWESELKDFNAHVAGIRAIKLRVEPLLAELNRITGGIDVHDPIHLPNALQAKRVFVFPKKLEAPRISANIKKYLRGTSVNVGRAAGQGDPAAVAVALALSAGVGIYMRQKYVRQLAEVDAGLGLYHAEAIAKTKLLQKLCEDRVSLMVGLLDESLEHICMIADTHDINLSNETLLLDEATRSRLIYEIHKAQRLLAVPFE